MTIFNNVNMIDIILSVIFLLSAYIGYRKGLLLTVVNILRYSLGFSLCFYCSDSLARPVYDIFLKQRAVDYVSNNIVSASGVDDTLANIANFKSSLPPFLEGFINVDSVTIPTGEDVTMHIVNTIVEPALITISKGLIFVLVYLLFFGATGLLIHLATKSSRRREKRRKEKHKRKSLSKQTNQVLGALLGIIKSAVLVLAIVSVLGYVQSVTDTGDKLYQLLNDSVILQFLNNINPFNALTGGRI